MRDANEVITYWIGQCGVQMADASWELLCLEHRMGPDGKFHKGKEPDDTSFKHFFHESVNNQYVPRAILVDSEPNVVDEIRSGIYRNLFHPDYIINSNEDASNNFARGFYRIGKLIIKDIVKSTRKMIEACDMIQAFIVNHSYGGGTGAGFSSILMEFLGVEFSKISRIQMGLFPSPTLSTSVVEPYNAVLSIHTPMESADLAMFFDNESLFRICENKLNIDNPVFTNLNRLLAQVFSGLTAAFRFEGPSTTKLIDLQINLVPYPRIHFPSIGFAPIESPFKAIHDTLTTKEITFAVLSKGSQLLTFDPKDGINVSCALLYRGEICLREISTTLAQLKMSGKLPFVDWCPTGFKTGVNFQPMTLVPPSGMAYSSKSLTMVINSTAIKSVIAKLNQKFLSLFNKRAFVHWFIGEGMEEGEFSEAFEDVVLLEEDLKMLENVDFMPLEVPQAQPFSELLPVQSERRTEASMQRKQQSEPNSEISIPMKPASARSQSERNSEVPLQRNPFSARSVSNESGLRKFSAPSKSVSSIATQNSHASSSSGESSTDSDSTSSSSS